MQMRQLAGGAVLVAIIVALGDRALHGAPELVVVWLLAIIGIAIAGTTLLLALAGRDDGIARATVARNKRP